MNLLKVGKQIQVLVSGDEQECALRSQESFSIEFFLELLELLRVVRSLSLRRTQYSEVSSPAVTTSSHEVRP